MTKAELRAIITAQEQEIRTLATVSKAIIDRLERELEIAHQRITAEEKDWFTAHEGWLNALKEIDRLRAALETVRELRELDRQALTEAREKLKRNNNER